MTNFSYTRGHFYPTSHLLYAPNDGHKIAICHIYGM